MQNPDALCLNCLKDTGGETPCPHCGFDEKKGNSTPFLPLKTVLSNRYVVGCAVQANGEGATYTGWDKELKAPVYIREYLPVGLFERPAGDTQVTPVSGSEYPYNTDLMKFLELARGLAQVRELSSLFPVYDIFEENGTAYYISEYMENITLREFLIRNGGALTWEQARPLFMPVISTLHALHGAGIIHRGICPETLVVTIDGRLRLTGFCVADARTARTPLSAELPKGYAAIEQYGFDGTPGAWTDVYGIAATIFRTLVGNTPPEATARVTNDKMIIPAAVAEKMPTYLLPALAGALQILPEDRTQNMDQFREEISGAPSVTAKASQRVEKAAKQAGKKKKGEKRYAALAAMITIITILVVALLVVLLVFGKNLFNGDATSTLSDAPMITTEPLDSELYTTRADDGTSISAPALKGLVFQDYLTSTDQTLMSIRDQLKFTIVRKEYNSAREGTVLEQSPEAGTKVQPGDTIQVVLSMGSESVSIPSTLVGKTRDEAYITLLELGFRPDSIVFMNANVRNMPYNTVSNVEPKPGTTLSRDSIVFVYINQYQPPTTQPTTTPPETTTQPPETPDYSW